MELTIKERQFIFQCRTRDIDVKANRSWKYDDIYCRICNNYNVNIDETQEHTLACEKLILKQKKLVGT